MARIPQGDIDRIKQELSVQRLAEARGIELKRHGKELLGRCPFHDDRTPSLAIDPAKNLWHCLGACQTGGRSDRLGDEGGGREFSLRRRADPQ